MSGFFGIIRTDGAAVEQEFLDRISRSLEFRGPDGTRTWRKDNAGFCFTLLDTGTPHESRNQPVSLGGRDWLLGDVRLDARRELVAELCGKGQPVGEHSPDEELLLQCWKVWGETTLLKILGDFSFALWDAGKKSLCCARDFVGARPFYYAQGPGVFCFSNTLQTLRRVPEISNELDDLFVRDFLLEGISKDPVRTVWRSVRRLQAGHRLIYSNGKTDVQRFLQLPIEEPLRLKRAEEYLENFRELLERGVADRLPAGKVALYLSGGLDSASVCATAARVVSRQRIPCALKAFTVSWRPLIEDPEPEFAKLTARHLALEHEILQDDRSLPEDDGQEETSPEPTSEIFLGRAYRLYSEIGAYSRVVLSGDGGDNILEGQAWPYLQYLWTRRDWSGIVRSFGSYVGAHGRFPPLRGGFRTRLHGWIRPKASSGALPAWLNEDFSRRIQAQTQGSAPQTDSLPEHPVHPQAYRGLHSGYWAAVLEEEDAGWNRINLETRAPFLDLRLLMFLLRLPPVPWCMHKELTRQAMRGQLPVEILKRPKTPLVRDLLEACQQRAGWRPEIGRNPPKMMENFVIWNSWLATLEKPKGLLSWENLYPLSLAKWLKVIENGKGIQ